ncbi:hypothetical protein V9L05_15230 [Bernardetia sp. Wsw4-3y2]|uniref:hypothetical protein n=1 Tax=Bernardetia sp. Wsw4-3y2 TaxID=3127471 RepID=UPI0030CD8D7F
MSLGLVDVTKTTLGDDSKKGISVELLYAHREEIESIPDRDGVTAEGLATISGDIVFKTGGRFYKLYSTREKGEIRYSMEGEDDSKSITSMLEIYVPGQSAQILGWIDANKNQDFVFLVRETCGNWRLMGDSCWPCKMDTAEGTTGKTRSDAKGNTIVFSSEGMAPVYTGVRQETPQA